MTMKANIILFAAALLVSAAFPGCGMQKGNASVISEQTAPITSAAETVVEISSGKIAGVIDNGVYIYKGIPYAKAERFMPPQAADRWEGVRSCRAYGPTAPQGARAGWRSDEQAYAFAWDDGYPGEDCQRINVWSKNVGGKKKLPVMVWLHGGGYADGSGQELPSYDGTSLASTGEVVVVTLNHRLNVLGFLDLSSYGDKYASSGNAGLLDIVEALRWVKENIGRFGGDPDNVTIFGQSGGGGKVSTLLATPAAEGLFHKAIVESGSMLRTMTRDNSRKIGEATMAELGLSPGDIDKIQSIPYDRLLAAGEKAVAKVRTEAEKEGITSFIFGWAPTVDGTVLPRQPFDPAAPEQAKNIPMIIGTTLHEFNMSAYVPALRGIDEAKAVEILKQKYGERADEYVAAFSKAYPVHTPNDLIDIDVIFRPSAIEQAKIKEAQQGAPVYMYQFAWESPVLDGIFRSVHCMEIPFVFDNTDLHASMTGGGDGARALARKMSRAWISFAKTGNPNIESLPEWKPFTPSGGDTMIFGDTCRVVKNHDKELMDFVRSFPTRGF